MTKSLCSHRPTSLSPLLVWSPVSRQPMIVSLLSRFTSTHDCLSTLTFHVNPWLSLYSHCGCRPSLSSLLSQENVVSEDVFQIFLWCAVEMICLLFISIVDWDISDYDREHGILWVHLNAKQAFITCFQSQDVGLPAVDDNGRLWVDDSLSFWLNDDFHWVWFLL